MHVFYILLDYICITGKYEDYLIMPSLPLLKALVIGFYGTPYSTNRDFLVT